MADASYRERLTKRAETVYVSLIALSFALLNAGWIWRFRNGKPVNIDEAGYMGFSLIDYHALMGPGGGPLAWWSAADSPSIYAPLMMGVSSLSYVLLGPNEFAAFLTPVLFGVVTVVACYYLARSLGGPALGVLASVLVATCPAIINESREYNFPMPAAAVLTLAALALVRSERFTRLGWSIAFGVFLGLTPLSRSMCIAFVPGLVIAASSQVLTGERRLRRAAVLSSALVIAVLVAATWLARSGPLVWKYLVSYGYGTSSLDTGNRENLFSYGAWVDTLRQIHVHAHFPYLVLLLAGALAVAVLAVQSLQTQGWRTGLRRALESPVTPVVLVIAEGLIALASTGNKGSGFIVALIPLMLVVAAWGMFTVSRGNTTMVSATVAMAAFFCLPMVDLSLPFAKPWTGQLPYVGYIAITDGRAPIQMWEGGAMDQATASAWRAVNLMVSRELVAHAPEGVRTGIGFLNPFLNVNTISLERWLQTAGRNGHNFYPPLDTTATGDSVSGYARWLSEHEPRPVCLLLTERMTTARFGATVSPAFMEEAAKRSGFVPVATWELPDGNVLSLRRRPSTCSS